MMDLFQLRHYLRTIRYLKPVQVRYRLIYRIRSFWRSLSGYSYTLDIPRNGNPISLVDLPQREITCRGTFFTLLNVLHRFDSGIDWNYNRHGRLWCYHLNAFYYLQQEGMSKEAGLGLIRDFVAKADDISTGMEPWPLSVRCRNWIKFLSRHLIRDVSVDACLFSQYQILLDNIEYHQMGNHLLENGFSLLAGGLYFSDSGLLDKGREILARQLDEQILNDGGHIERSPMYHAILLESLLDCLNLAGGRGGNSDLEELLKPRAIQMAGWFRNMMFRSGDIPHFNDSTDGVAVPARELMNYLERLGLAPGIIIPGESGYRRFDHGEVECIVDVGDIGPDYQPGHAHSDTFGFVLYNRGLPLIVDRGISTYEEAGRRLSERSTASHNTFQLGQIEQSEVWALFRVAERARCRILDESARGVSAEHDGYRSLGVLSRREFRLESDSVTWIDEQKGRDTGLESTGYIHFHPDVQISLEGTMVASDRFRIHFEGDNGVRIGEYEFCEGFNRRRKAQKIQVTFSRKMSGRMEFL